MAKQVFLYVEDASGVEAEAAQFTGLMRDKGWRVLDDIRLCFVKPLADGQSLDLLDKQITADVADAAYQADWGRTVATFVVSEEGPRVLPIDQWKGATAKK